MENELLGLIRKIRRKKILPYHIIWRALAALGFSATLAACATSTAKVAPTYDPTLQQDVASSFQRLRSLSDRQYDVLAPETFHSAEAHVKKADHDIKNGAPAGDIAKELERAKNRMDSVEIKVSLALPHIPELLDIRAQAIRAGASPLASFSRAEDRMRDLGRHIEDRDINYVLKNRDQVYGLYRQAQMEATQNKELGAAPNTQPDVRKMREQKFAEIRSLFSPREADVLLDGERLILRLRSINFESGSAAIPATSKATLNKVAEVLQDIESSRIIVEGHTDSVGPSDVNDRISRERAQAVTNYLESQGVTEDIPLDTVGYGYSRPITENKTALGRAQNRRIDVVIDGVIVPAQDNPTQTGTTAL